MKRLNANDPKKCSDVITRLKEDETVTEENEKIIIDLLKEILKELKNANGNLSMIYSNQ